MKRLLSYQGLSGGGPSSGKDTPAGDRFIDYDSPANCGPALTKGKGQGTLTQSRRAKESGRVRLTHDVATMARCAYDRVREGKRMPGAFEVGRPVAIGVAIEEIVLLAECSPFVLEILPC
jgi:hypothetical protein